VTHPDIQNDQLRVVHGKSGKVVGVRLVPGEPDKGLKVWGLINDGGVIQGSQVEHAN